MKKKLAMVLCTALLAASLAGCSSGSSSSSSETAEEETAEEEAEEAEETEEEAAEEETAEAAEEEETETAEEEAEEETAEEYDGEVLTIEFFQQKSEEGPQNGYQAIIDKFNEENPDIYIEMNTVPDASTVLTSRISSGDIPVIFSDYPTQVQFKQKVANGYVQELTGQDFLSNVAQSALDMTEQEDGGYYALPYSRNYMGVFYNQAIFEEYEIEIPTTWDEFVDVCETLQAAGVTPVGLAGKDPGRVGHAFQAAVVAWIPDGVETIENVAAGEETLSGNEDFIEAFTKMATLLGYANDDALALSDTQCYENFSNGEYAMCITGSYAKGTIEALNSDLTLGVFPLPNDTYETTNTLSGIDAAICVSAEATDEEKEAAYRFLAYLAEPENAQIFADYDGAPPTIEGVESADEGVTPMTDLIAAGQVHDWMASTIDNNIVTDMYNVVQGFWMDLDVDAVLEDLDASIAINAAG